MKLLIFFFLVAAHGWPLTLSPPTDIAEIGLCREVGTAINESGDIALIWGNQELYGKRLYASCKEAGQWTPPQQLTTEDFSSPHCSIDPNGMVQTFWGQNEDRWEPQIYSSKRVGSTFEEPQKLCAGKFIKYVVDPAGVASIYRVYREADSTKVQRIDLNEGSITTLYEGSSNIEFDENDFNPEEEICSVSLVHTDASEWVLVATVKDSEPAVISHPFSCSMHHQISIDEAKNILVVWKEDETDILYAAYKPFDEPWSPFVEVATLSKTLSGMILPFEVRNSSGKFLLVWQHEQIYQSSQ